MPTRRLRLVRVDAVPFVTVTVADLDAPVAGS
jgi:hypothetical protein